MRAIPQEPGITSSGDNLEQLFRRWIVPALELESNEIEKKLEEDIWAIKKEDSNRLILRLRIAILCLRLQVLDINSDDKKFLGTFLATSLRKWKTLKEHLAQRFTLKYRSDFVDEDGDEVGTVYEFVFLVNNQISNEDEYLKRIADFFQKHGITLKEIQCFPGKPSV
jgi:hypothetical protein